VVFFFFAIKRKTTDWHTQMDGYALPFHQRSGSATHEPIRKGALQQKTERFFPTWEDDTKVILQGVLSRAQSKTTVRPAWSADSNAFSSLTPCMFLCRHTRTRNMWTKIKKL
jgi:hypothetical protein